MSHRLVTPHPNLPDFDYIRPKNLAEASRFLAEHAGQARPLLGGTDVFVRMRDGVWTEPILVDVKKLDGMGEIHYEARAGLSLGAAVSMNRVIASPEVQTHYPLLAEACRSVASYQLRTRATVAGNLCNASPAGDTIGACLVYGGSLCVHGVSGERQEALDSFFLGPGETVLQPGDIVTALRLPPPPPGCAGRYLKLNRNAIGDLAIVGVTVLGFPDPGAASGYRFRIVLASVAPVPLVPAQAEAILAESTLNQATLAEAAQAAMEACTPIDDVRGGSRYRRLMVRNLTRKGLEEVWGKLRQDS